MLRGLYLILGGLLLNLFVFGQEDSGVKFNITVKHKSSVYSYALIKVYRSSSFLDQSNVNQQGGFSYLMPYGFVYQLHFTGEGMATKIIELDLISNIPESEKNTVHDWSIGEIELFKSYKEIDITKLAQPVARIHYESDMSEFSIDYKYTGKRKKELAGVEEQVEKLEKKEAVVEKANKKEYEELVVKGNKALNIRQFKSAQAYFEKAVVLNSEGEAKQKLSAINKVLKKEEKYKVLIAQAKDLYEKGELQQASQRYVSASAVKPTSEFPKQQIALIAQKIKQDEKQANAFNNFMAVANRAYSEGNFVAASAGFKKALDINPDALLASKKLEFSETKIKEKEVQEATDQKFDNLIVEAKNARVRGDLSTAEKLLAQAELVKPGNEILTAEKVSVEKLVTKQRKNEAQLAVDQKFSNLILDSKNARANGDLIEAERVLAQAEAIKPNDITLASEKSAVAVMRKEHKNEKALAQQALVEENEKEEKYANYLALAKKSESSGNKKEAIFFYKKAQGFKPQSEDVYSALATLNKATVEPVTSTSKTAEAVPNINLDKMDKKSSAFQSKLATLYPEGKTVHKSSKGNKAITQVIVVSEGRGIEYQQIKYNWGGVYYFKNGDPITKLIFEKETK